MDNMKVNNKRLQKLILDTQKSVGQLSKLAYETGVQDGLIKANALNALNPLDNTSMRWIPCTERLPDVGAILISDGNKVFIGAYLWITKERYDFTISITFMK